MERSDESNESGYDGGSQENILSEPHYETVGKKGGKGKEDKKQGSTDKKQGSLDNSKQYKDKIEKDSYNTRNEKKSLPIPNGSAKFAKENESKKEAAEESQCKHEPNKVTIHAIIETIRRDDDEEIKTTQTYEIDESIYEKVDDIRESMSEKRIITMEEDESDDDQETNKEVVYSRVSIQKTIQKPEIEKKEVKEERRMVQELVKVAEDEGIPSKIPTPPKLPSPPPTNLHHCEANEDTTFLEEEYSYEPELKKSSSKLVLRTRSLLNLEEENTKSDRTYVRPPAIRMKITTGPDGTFVIDGRKATSELNLADQSRNVSSKVRMHSICGEELRRRKEEIFKPKEQPQQNAKKYHDEINQNKTRTTKEEAIHNLKKYLKENNIGLRELLTNNNVVIIDTFNEKKAVDDLAEYNHKTVRDCRITGTTAKGDSRESHTLPRANKVQQPVVQRHYFYRLAKCRTMGPDEELPDPDKVRSTRQMFQKSKEKVPRAAIMLPIAAKVANPRNDPRPTNEVRLINPDGSPRRWTDSGSLSSGVSSDMSLLDNMSDKCYSSEDEGEEEPSSPIIDTHPISPEVLKKIRACGTTITYYGGRVIAHSHGPGNPMTMTIMDEIRQGKEVGRGKFRLVKSNSCGSRLELAGTDDGHYHEMSRGRFYEDVYGGRSLCEEMRSGLVTVEEEKKADFLQKNEMGKTGMRKYGSKQEINGHDISKFYPKSTALDNDKKPSWRELIESRKQKRVMEHNRRPCPDMVFEEFQVLETK